MGKTERGGREWGEVGVGLRGSEVQSGKDAFSL